MIAPILEMGRPDGPSGVEIAGYVVVADAGAAVLAVDIFQLVIQSAAI